MKIMHKTEHTLFYCKNTNIIYYINEE